MKALHPPLDWASEGRSNSGDRADYSAPGGYRQAFSNARREANRRASSRERWTLTVTEAAVLLGVGRNTCYAAIARGELPAVRLGRRLLVPRIALEKLLAEAGRPSERGEVIGLQSERRRGGRRRGRG
jgi:excisionase family DNA binding protein